MSIKVQRSVLEYILSQYGEGKVSILAKKIGITPIYLYKVIRSDIPVGNKFIKGLMKLTNLSFSALFYYSEKPTGSSGAQ